ncbi:Oryzin [Orbilia brochopaga]|nr:Oryzin [Drechslerella brochopaga]
MGYDEFLSKIGTLDQYSENFVFIVKKSFRHDPKYKADVIQWLHRIALPPRRLSYQPAESSYLGWMMFQVELPPKPIPRIRDFSQAMRHGLEEQWWEGMTYGNIDTSVEEPWRRAITGTEGSVIDGSHSGTNAIQARSPIPSPPINEPKESFSDLGSSFLPEVVQIYDGYYLPELSLISQPPGVRYRDMRSFWNYKTLGEGQVVYVVDTGCDMDHPELADTHFQDWIFAGGFPSDEQADFEYARQDYHGTQVISKLTGKHVGVAQKASIVVVKLRDGRDESHFFAVVGGFIQIYDHIRRKNSNANCIINVSVGLTPDHESYRPLFEEVIRALTDLPNVIIVAAAGNGEPVSITFEVYLVNAMHAIKVGFTEQIVVSRASETPLRQTPWHPLSF